MRLGPDGHPGRDGAGDVTTIAAIQRNLAEIERLAAETADAIRQMVPDGCDRDAPILAAWNRTGGIAAEAARAIRDFRRAIRET